MSAVLHHGGSILVTLSAIAVWLGDIWAAEATELAEPVPNPTICDHTQTQEERDWRGLRGEWALAWCEGLPIWKCGMALNGRQMDGGSDVVRPDGRTIQVKAIRVRKDKAHVFEGMWWVLDSTDRRKFTAEYGVLAYVLDSRRVCLYGFFDQDLFAAKACVVSLGTGPRLGIRASELRPMSEWDWFHGQPVCPELGPLSSVGSR